MAKSRPFLIPVCVDDTPEEDAEVPESFSLVHWTRLPAGETPTAFVERVVQLLSAARHLPIAHAAPDGALPAATDSARAAVAAYDTLRGTSSRALVRKLQLAAILGGSIRFVAGAMLWLAAGTGLATSAGRLSTDLAAGLSPRSGTSYVLYVSRRAGRPGIWKLANGVSRELWVGSQSDSVSAPAIASDGRIAFTVARGERTSLYVMQSDGAHPSVVTESFALRGNTALGTR